MFFLFMTHIERMKYIKSSKADMIEIHNIYDPFLGHIG